MKVDWLEHLRIITDILDIFWESKTKTTLELERKGQVNPIDVVSMVNSKLITVEEGRKILKKMGITLDDNIQKL